MKQKFKNMDKILFFLVILYTGLGLVMLFSASSMSAVLQYNYSESYFFVKQAVFFTIAYIIGFIILFLPMKLINLMKKSYKLIGLSAIILLVVTLICGEEVNGSTSWIRLFGISIQTSEFVKTIIILAISFSFYNPRMLKKYKFLTPFAYAVICIGLIFIQPDWGTAMILGFICFLLFLSIPIQNGKYTKLKIFTGGVVIVAILMFLFGKDIFKNVSFLSEKKLSRLTYANPCARYSEETGYQVCNGYIAINNGGLFGVGLGNSTQKYLYLPEAYTDFIFPIIVEELGSIISTLIILGYLVMLYRILKIARQSETLTGSMLAYGTFSFILFHLLVNLLGVLAIIPLTGVPLPFLSSGGSFNLNLIILIFITERVCIESRNKRFKKEIANL